MDIFIGVLANAGLVVLGGAAGCMFRSEKIKRISQRIFEAFALFVIVLGAGGTSDLSHPVIILVSLIAGVAIGELIDLDDKFSRLGNWAEGKLPDKWKGSFAEGLVEATLLFCIGSMTFMGAMESALSHTHTIYITKGTIDAISALAMAASLGPGVIFSSAGVIVYQGLLVLVVSLLGGFLTPETISLCTTVGSLFLIGIGLNILKITKLKVANFLPAMFVPIFWQFFSGLF